MGVERRAQPRNAPGFRPFRGGSPPTTLGTIAVGSGIGETVCQLRQSIASLTLTPTRLPTFFFDAPKSLDFVGHSFPIVATHNGLVDRSVTRPPHRIFQRPLAMAIDYALSLSLDAIRIAKAKSHLTTLPETKNFFCPKFRPRSRERLCG